VRLFDIAILLALFGSVLGVMDSSGWFPGGEISIEETGLTESEIAQMKGVGGADTGDPGGMIASAWAGWNIILILISALYRVLWIRDIIIGIFGAGVATGTPDALMVVSIASVIQVGIWMIYGIGLFQMIRKTSIAHMQ
jgi:hypothetical protein